MSAIMTYTRKMFDPIHPEAENIDIVDIAHALAMLCRANGHFGSFYSVAQHSLNCMHEAADRGLSPRICLACLLHDASEAYLADVTRPVKAELPRYREMEKPLQDMIWNKWLGEPLTEQELEQVFQIDDAVLAHEFLHFMNTEMTSPMPGLCSVPEYSFAGFDACKQEFLAAFCYLTSGEKETFVVGIDWMKPCWLAAEICGSKVSMRKFSHISEINQHYRTADAVLIDIPVGLPENAEENARRPDKAARRLLPTERKPSVFPVPCRQAIAMEEYASASTENQRVLGKKLTSQSHAFCKMIRQVDTFLEEDPRWKNRLTESHPEVAFQMLSGKPLQYSKHTEEGIGERIAILRSYDIDPVAFFADFAPKQYADVLDALCLAVSAKLGCENGFCTIPGIPAGDSHGLKMQMVFGKV